MLVVVVAHCIFSSKGYKKKILANISSQGCSLVIWKYHSFEVFSLVMVVFAAAPTQSWKKTTLITVGREEGVLFSYGFSDYAVTFMLKCIYSEPLLGGKLG